MRFVAMGVQGAIFPDCIYNKFNSAAQLFFYVQL